MASKSEGVFTRWLDSSMKSTGRLRFGDERMSFVSDLSIFDWQSFLDGVFLKNSQGNFLLKRGSCCGILCRRPIPEDWVRNH